MKLHDITEMTVPGDPQELRGQEEDAITQKVYPNLKPTGKTSENLEIQSADMGDDGLFFALVDKGNVLIWLNVVIYKSFPDDPNRKSLWIKRSYTPSDFRRKGYSEALYFGLSKMGYRVVSDKQLADPGANQMWQKFAKRGDVKHWDTTRKEFIEPDSGINGFDNPNIRHVLEHSHNPDIPTIGTGILGEQIFWTSPNVASGDFFKKHYNI